MSGSLALYEYAPFWLLGDSGSPVTGQRIFMFKFPVTDHLSAVTTAA